MTLLFMDGFNHYNCDTFLEDLNEMELKWERASRPTTTNSNSYDRRVHIYGQGLRLSDTAVLGTPVGIGKGFTDSSTVIFGFAFKFLGGAKPGDYPGFPGYSSSPFINLNSVGFGYGIDVIVNSDFTMSVLNGETKAVYGTTEAALLPNTRNVNSWTYIEMKVFVSNTVGTVELRINEIPWLKLSGIDTCVGGTSELADGLQINPFEMNLPVIVDDLYICNNLGSTNNDFLGECAVSNLFPDGAGTYTDFTESTPVGYNWGNVNEKFEIDQDATYNQGTAIDQKDSYNIDPITHLQDGEIYGIALNTTARQDGIFLPTFTPFVRLSSTDYFQTPFASSGTDWYLVYSLMETNPNTSLQWVDTDLTNMEIGLKFS